MLEVGTGIAPDMPRHTDSATEVLQVRMPSRPDAAALAAAGLRDRIAERRSLAQPADASRRGRDRSEPSGRIGRLFESSETLVSGGFRGTIYPVNPHARNLGGLKAYPSISAVTGSVDLALIAVPAAAAAAVVAQCAAAGVGAVVLLTAAVATSAGRGGHGRG